MSKTINIGKNTLGSGGKMEVNLHNYDSSTSDKSYTFKTTGSAGTLIPFMSEVALPESEWEINLDETDDSVYGLPLQKGTTGLFSIQSKQEGLLIKTYQSDLFNNWVSTEWIDGDNGVNQITAIDTSSGSFNIDTLNMSKKVYNMLNRIMLSGGSYDDWIETVYMGKKIRAVENPVYVGGLIKELAFQEVISNTQTYITSHICSHTTSSLVNCLYVAARRLS